MYVLWGRKWEEEIEDENQSNDVYIKLSQIKLKYSIPFICSFKYLRHPHAYVTASNVVKVGEGEDIYKVKIVRADQKSFDLHLDLSSSINLAVHFIKGIDKLTDNGVTADKNEWDKLMSAMRALDKVSGMKDEEYQ